MDLHIKKMIALRCMQIIENDLLNAGDSAFTIQYILYRYISFLVLFLLSSIEHTALNCILSAEKPTWLADD